MPDSLNVPSSPLGIHLIAEFFEARNLQDGAPVIDIMCQAAEAAGAVVLNQNIHDFGPGEGVTGIVMLAESHISIHTWPEHNYAAIDIFMCGDRAAPEICLDFLRSFFDPKDESVTRLNRGLAPARAQKQRTSVG